MIQQEQWCGFILTTRPGWHAARGCGTLAGRTKSRTDASCRSLLMRLVTRYLGAAMALLILHPARIALLVFATLALVVLAFAAALRNWHRVGALYRRCFSRSRRERQFIAAASFYLSFAIVRFVTHAIRSGVAPFHDIEIAGRHIHHLVFGILILLAVGYGWLLEFGSVIHANSRVSGRVMAILYGIGAALTLDEFALWLNLEDVYWVQEGRASIDAVLLFGALLTAGMLGSRFFRLLAREALRPFAVLRR